MLDSLTVLRLIALFIGAVWGYYLVVVPAVDRLRIRFMARRLWADLERARTSTTHADPGRPSVRTLAPCLRAAGAGAHGLTLVSPVRPVREPEPWSPTRLHAYRAELAEFGLSLDDSRIE